MIQNNYNIGKNISYIVKRNIAYDRIQILNFVCVNYVDSILKQSETFGPIDEEKRMKLLVVIDKLLK